MDWTRIILAAVIGAIAGGVSAAVPRRARLLTGVGLFVALNLLGNAFLVPRIQERQVERELAKIPAFAEIAKSDPATYKEMEAIIKEAAGRPDAEQYARSHVSALMSRSLPSRIKNAADAPVVEFTRSTVRAMQALNDADPNACYQFLFPDRVSQPTAMENVLSGPIGTDLLNRVAAVYTSSAGAIEFQIDPLRGQELLKPVTESLARDFGPDLELMVKPSTGLAERKRTCEVAIALYSRITELQDPDNAYAMRYVLASK